nr:hypothetical protein [Agromyces mangrovi]
MLEPIEDELEPDIELVRERVPPPFPSSLSVRTRCGYSSATGATPSANDISAPSPGVKGSVDSVRANPYTYASIVENRCVASAAEKPELRRHPSTRSKFRSSGVPGRGRPSIMPIAHGCSTRTERADRARSPMAGRQGSSTSGAEICRNAQSASESNTASLFATW